MISVTPANVHQALNEWLLADGCPVVCDLDKSSGAYLHDAKSDIEYLDFGSFSATRPLGFNHPKLRDAEFLDRISRVALHKPSNGDIYTVEYARFVDRFASVALAGAFRHVFFVEGACAAVDNAVKAALDWKHRKNVAAGRGEMGRQIVSFKQAFHGRTGYALSLTDSHDKHKQQFFPRINWPRVTNPKMHFPFDATASAHTEGLEAQALKEIDALFDAHRDDISAIIIEPVQCEGGDNYFRSEFLRSLRKICDEREALLIFDEVQTGFGSSGRWWDWQHHGVKPDLMVFGGKTQVCGFAAAERLDEIDGVFKVPARIASTFAGNLVDMVRCERIIQIIVEDHLIENAVTMGRYLHKLLLEQAAARPEITNVRSRGLLAAFDLPNQEDRDRVLKACFEEELLVLACGTNGVRLRPALDINADAVGRCAAQLEAALRRAYGRR